MRRAYEKEVGCKQNMPAGSLVPGLTHSLRVLWTLAPRVQLIATQHWAVGICSSAGEKVSGICRASWSVLIKSGLEQTGLTGEWWQKE